MSIDSNGSHVKKDHFLKRHPVFILLCAFAIYSIGIWNCQFGGGEDTGPIESAQVLVKQKHFSANLYENAYALILGSVTPDPVNAITLMKFIVSLASTLSLYFILMCFSSNLSVTSILMASFVWIAANVNTPLYQSTCLSTFAFSIILIGINFFFRNQNVTGVLVYSAFAYTAASLRPEYFAPLLFLVLALYVRCISWCISILEDRLQLTRFKSRLFSILSSLGVLLIASYVLRTQLAEKIAYCDHYLLFGFSQCYADFYHHEHPELVYSTMTEYDWLMKSKFGDPQSFFALVTNYPFEVGRYFLINGKKNLGHLAERLLSVRDGEKDHLQQSLVWVIFALGTLLSFRFANKRTLYSLVVDKQLRFKLAVLLSLASASSVSIILLIPNLRYWISVAPLLYLALAYCFDRILVLIRSNQARTVTLATIGSLFCYPHYTFAHPNNEFRALQHIAPLVKKKPKIIAWCTDPDRVFGFNGEALALSTNQEISAEDVTNCDILLIDHNFRSTHFWHSNAALFEDLEANPDKYGLKRVTDVNTDRFDILYRPTLDTNTKTNL